LKLFTQFFLADFSKLENQRDDHTFASLPDYEFERLLEHPLHLRWHAGERGEEHPAELEQYTHRGAQRVGDELGALGEEGLLVG